MEKASLDTPGNGSAGVGISGKVLSRTYHGLHSRYVVRSYGADIRLLVREDGGAHPEAGTETTIYLQPAHVLQYHPETGVALRQQDPAVALP